MPSCSGNCKGNAVCLAAAEITHQRVAIQVAKLLVVWAVVIHDPNIQEIVSGGKFAIQFLPFKIVLGYGVVIDGYRCGHGKFPLFLTG